MNSSNIHDNICSLIHKKCHPKHYYIDIKYHMTLNTIFSVDVKDAHVQTQGQKGKKRSPKT